MKSSRLNGTIRVGGDVAAAYGAGRGQVRISLVLYLSDLWLCETYDETNRAKRMAG
jgi:hypothetical protein